MTLEVDNHRLKLNNVLHVPGLSENLLSVAQLIQDGNIVKFDNGGCSVTSKDKSCTVKAIATDGVYIIRNSPTCMLSTAMKNKALMWHRRLGHLNYSDMCRMRDGAVDGINFIGGENQVRNCQVCCEGKQTRKPFGHSDNQRAEGILNLIHSDLCGPMETTSIEGTKYFLIFVDDYSRKVFVYFLKKKSDVFETFRTFKQLVENQTGRKIKILRTNNGTEYCSEGFKSFLGKCGIQHQTSNAYTPQQNGLAERMNRTLVEKAKCLIFDAKIDKSYWAEAVNMAAYITNRSINSTLKTLTPEEVWTKKRVNIEDLKLFGSEIMVHIPKEKRLKWDRKSVKILFVGYSSDTKGLHPTWYTKTYDQSRCLS